jgi:hypothetical protein
MTLDLAHPRRAARDPLKGATLAARQSRFRGVLGWLPLLLAALLF